MSFLAELKRRNVFRAAAAYVAVAWLAIQVAETTLPAFGLGDRALRLLILALAVGAVPAVALAWAFELTPEGLKRERDLDRGGRLAQRTNRLLDRAIVLLLALGITYFAVDKFFLSPAREQARIEQALEQGRIEALAEATGDTSIVVLPFTNLSSDPEQAFFADGLAEEVLNLLARIPELRVISRTSAFAFKGEDTGIAEIAAQLKVSHVLEGSVRRSGDRLRVTAQLIDARTDTHLWSETYDRALDDVFAIQDEIAGQVVAALEVELLDGMPQARRADPNAYALFMQARQMLDSGPEDYVRIHALLQRALELDPGYADAWTGIAWLHARCYRLREEARHDAFCGRLTPTEAMTRNLAAIQRALDLDPDNAIALSYQAWVQMVLRHDPHAAAAQFERAVRLGPTQTDVLRPAMIFANWVGQPQTAIRIGEYLRRRDPLCSLCVYNLALGYMNAGRLADAESTLRDIATMGRGGQYSLGCVLLLQNRAQDALDHFGTLSEEQDRAQRLAGEAMALHSLGRAAESDARLSTLETESAGSHARRIAEVYAWTGRPEQAATWLRRALDAIDEQESSEAYAMLSSPLLGSILERPELQASLRRHGVAVDQLAGLRFEPRLRGE